VNSYDQAADSDLIKNKKFFVPPQEYDLDLKALLRLLVAAGAGRPVDRGGMPSGPWTADLLADAISALDDTGAGVDLRTVQHWLQDNARGIRPENIRWLARIFGCDDPEATSQWQRELSLAQDRLVRIRRSKASTLAPGLAPADGTKIIIQTWPGHSTPEPNLKKPDGFRIGRWSERLFSNQSPLMLPAFVWAGWIVLGFIAYILGLHDVTYRATDSVEKQVGFFWAPNWTVLELGILPLFLTVVSSALGHWKEQRKFLARLADQSGETCDWQQRVDAFRPLLMIACGLCFFVVFALQWLGVHLRVLLAGTIGSQIVDWSLIVLVRPELVTVAQTAILSSLAYFYTACICFLFLIGLILMLAIVQDFVALLKNGDASNIIEPHRDVISAVYSVILHRVFKAAILGVWIATCIKVQAVYLLSDGNNILNWLAEDARRSFLLEYEPVNRLGHKALAHFTSFLLLFVTVLVFAIAFVSAYRINRQTGHPLWLQEARPARRFSMPVVIVLLICNFFLVGQFAGFSIVLLASLVVSIVILVGSSSQSVDVRMQLSDGWRP
jgi:hypothetical protein